MPITDAAEAGELSPKTFARFARVHNQRTRHQDAGVQAVRWFRAGCFAGFVSCN